MVGTLVPDDEPAWQLILNLKDIVILVVSPIHCAETIFYLEFKISEHQQLFREVFPHKKLLPKHHYPLSGKDKMLWSPSRAMDHKI